MLENERCTAMVSMGMRGYIVVRCDSRAVRHDPDQLCRAHREERDAQQAVNPAFDRHLRDLEARFGEIARHLAEFYNLRTSLEYDMTAPGRPCTGRLLVRATDLLQVLGAQDLAPPRWRR
ncbi:hypothetical protein [Frankia sp. EAN1pec]|uniref:hypothetical protein n=1 Tax=Parafrankia sp. (strain EAN1pec) TaxID=298653 RepID=UPI000054465C